MSTQVPGTVTTSKGTVVLGNSPGNTRVRVNVGTVNSGEVITIRLWVRVNLNLPDSIIEIVNQGLVTSIEVPDLPTDDPLTGGQGDSTQCRSRNFQTLHAHVAQSAPGCGNTDTDADPKPDAHPHPHPDADTGSRDG